MEKILIATSGKKIINFHAKNKKMHSRGEGCDGPKRDQIIMKLEMVYTRRSLEMKANDDIERKASKKHKKNHTKLIKTFQKHAEN